MMRKGPIPTPNFAAVVRMYVPDSDASHFPNVWRQFCDQRSNLHRAFSDELEADPHMIFNSLWLRM